jgi:NAD(P)-dependent dehydrogenase (short-subunit alcohol dehydrogenase family)
MDGTDSAPMDGKLAVITGGNSGIGRATAEGLARQGAHVVIACRNGSTAAETAKAITAATGRTVDTVRLDLADLDSVREAAAEILRRWDRLDVLVNNAGLARTRRGVTKQGFETAFGVNYLGHVLLTDLLLDRLWASAPSRIVFVGAHAHHLARSGLDFGDLQSERSYRTMLAYGRSKLAAMYYTADLAERLDGSGVTVNGTHPGVVNTNFAISLGSGPVTRRVLTSVYALVRRFMRTPEQGADTVVWLASSPDADGVTGGYFVDRKPATVSSAARDRDAARRLREMTERMLADGHP